MTLKERGPYGRDLKALQEGVAHDAPDPSSSSVLVGPKGRGGLWCVVCVSFSVSTMSFRYDSEVVGAAQLLQFVALAVLL